MIEARILLVRHPETEANVDGRFVGRGDSPFTSEGREQLARLPLCIARFEPDSVWSSPLYRARQVAERAAGSLGLEVCFDERLLELDFGEAEGMTVEEIEAEGMAFNYRDSESPVAPGGESRDDIARRAASFCDEVCAKPGRYAVVTHGGVFRASLVHLLGLHRDGIWAFHVHNAQLATVRVIDGHGILEEYVVG